MANTITSVNLCSLDLPCENQQIDFDNTAAQTAYFNSKVVKNIPLTSYQPRDGVIDVKGYVDQFTNVNYGFYTNTYGSTTKTYYFFVTQRSFLSKSTTRLTIQLDLIQTWLFDAVFKECFIEREHASVDTVGSNTIPEDFELGEYMAMYRKKVDSLTGEIDIFVAVTDNDDIAGGFFGKTFSGFTLYYFDYNSVSALNAFISSYAAAGKADAIAFIFSFPHDFIQYGNSSGDFTIANGTAIAGMSTIFRQTVSFDWAEQNRHFISPIETYLPRNMKLYTYPYSFITIRNAAGANVVLKNESFTDITSIDFLIETVLTQNPRFTLTPLQYNGKSYAIEDSIDTNGFGLCSWNNDNYANWFAQHSNTLKAQSDNAYASYKANYDTMQANNSNAKYLQDLSGLQATLNTGNTFGSQLGSGNIVGALTGGASGLANMGIDYAKTTANINNDLANTNRLINTDFLNQTRSILASVHDAKVQPNNCKGDTSSSGLDMARNTNTFYIEQTGIRAEYAKMIDMFFQMFGYKSNRVGVPTYNKRVKWDYIKTVNAVVVGNVPIDDRVALAALYNGGVTFWHDPQYAYNYNQSNPIRTV